MDISFKTAALQKVCNSSTKLRERYGRRRGRLIERRLLELSAVECLADTQGFAGLWCHELTTGPNGLLAVDLAPPDQLAFCPGDDPLPKNVSGGLDWSRVTKIVVEGIGDYH